jgi:Tfp pilus assembly protein PilO
MFSTELRKVIAFTVFGGLVLTVFYFFFWNPNISSIKKTQEEMKIRQGVFAQIKRDVETWPKTKTEENLKKAKEKLQELLAKIPEEEDISGILEHIQKYGATAAHLNIVGITNVTGKATKQKPSENVEESTYAKVTYKLTADGSFLNVIRFLRGLEAAERLIVIDDLDIKRVISEKKGSVRAVVTLSLFYSKPELVISEETPSQL